MRNQRKKKQTDSNLVEDYRFIVSLHARFKAMEFKVCVWTFVHDNPFIAPF